MCVAGMDIKHTPNATAMLTLGKDMTFRDYAQVSFPRSSSRLPLACFARSQGMTWDAAVAVAGSVQDARHRRRTVHPPLHHPRGSLPNPPMSPDAFIDLCPTPRKPCPGLKQFASLPQVANRIEQDLSEVEGLYLDPKSSPSAMAINAAAWLMSNQVSLRPASARTFHPDDACVSSEQSARADTS